MELLHEGPHSLFLNSATSALHLAVILCDLPPRSRIATTALTFVSTNAVIVQAGHIPVFCDIDPETLSLAHDPARFEKCAAVMWVHHGGSISPDFEEFMSWRNACRPSIRVIEDCAHASGASYRDGSKVGSRLDTLSCFSFQAVKNLPTADSGMLCGANAALMARARRLSWLGIDKSTYGRSQDKPGAYNWRYTVEELGFKYNGNDVMAALARVQLRQLDEGNAKRKHLYEVYRDELYDSGVAWINHEDKGSSHHLMVVRVKDRERVITRLKENGIAPGVHYLPNFEFEAFSKYYERGSCPETERVGEEILSLPNHLQMDESDVKRVCKVLADAD